MSRNKQIDKLRDGLTVLRIPAGGILPKDPVDRALIMLERNIILIDRLQEKRNAAVAQHGKIEAMWREAVASHTVAKMELGDMRRRMIEIQMSKP